MSFEEHNRKNGFPDIQIWTERSLGIFHNHSSVHEAAKNYLILFCLPLWDASFQVSIFRGPFMDGSCMQHYFHYSKKSRAAHKRIFSPRKRERDRFPLDIKIAWLLNVVFFFSLSHSHSPLRKFEITILGALTQQQPAVYIYLLQEVHAISDFVEKP